MDEWQAVYYHQRPDPKGARILLSVPHYRRYRLAPRTGIPRLEDGATKADQTEHVTINGRNTIVQRGHWVEVPQDVYVVLRGKYPHI